MPRNPDNTTVCYTVRKTDKALIQALAIELTTTHQRKYSDSAALRHILNVYTRLDENLRHAAIVANDTA